MPQLTSHLSADFSSPSKSTSSGLNSSNTDHSKNHSSTSTNPKHDSSRSLSILESATVEAPPPRVTARFQDPETVDKGSGVTRRFPYTKNNSNSHNVPRKKRIYDRKAPQSQHHPNPQCHHHHHHHLHEPSHSATAQAAVSTAVSDWRSVRHPTRKCVGEDAVTTPSPVPSPAPTSPILGAHGGEEERASLSPLELSLPRAARAASSVSLPSPRPFAAASRRTPPPSFSVAEPWLGPPSITRTPAGVPRRLSAFLAFRGRAYAFVCDGSDELGRVGDGDGPHETRTRQRQETEASRLVKSFHAKLLLLHRAKKLDGSATATRGRTSSRPDFQDAGATPPSQSPIPSSDAMTMPTDSEVAAVIRLPGVVWRHDPYSSTVLQHVVCPEAEEAAHDVTRRSDSAHSTHTGPPDNAIEGEARQEGLVARRPRRRFISALAGQAAGYHCGERLMLPQLGWSTCCTPPPSLMSGTAVVGQVERNAPLAGAGAVHTPEKCSPGSATPGSGEVTPSGRPRPPASLTKSIHKYLFTTPVAATPPVATEQHEEPMVDASAATARTTVCVTTTSTNPSYSTPSLAGATATTDRGRTPAHHHTYGGGASEPSSRALVATPFATPTVLTGAACRRDGEGRRKVSADAPPFWPRGVVPYGFTAPFAPSRFSAPASLSMGGRGAALFYGNTGAAVTRRIAFGTGSEGPYPAYAPEEDQAPVQVPIPQPRFKRHGRSTAAEGHPPTSANTSANSSCNARDDGGSAQSRYEPAETEAATFGPKDPAAALAAITRAYASSAISAQGKGTADSTATAGVEREALVSTASTPPPPPASGLTSLQTRKETASWAVRLREGKVSPRRPTTRSVVHPRLPPPPPPRATASEKDSEEGVAEIRSPLDKAHSDWRRPVSPSLPPTPSPQDDGLNQSFRDEPDEESASSPVETAVQGTKAAYWSKQGPPTDGYDGVTRGAGRGFSYQHGARGGRRPYHPYPHPPPQQQPFSYPKARPVEDVVDRAVRLNTNNFPQFANLWELMETVTRTTLFEDAARTRRQREFAFQQHVESRGNSWHTRGFQRGGGYRQRRDVSPALMRHMRATESETRYVFVLQHRVRRTYAVGPHPFDINALVVVDGDMGLEMAFVAACVPIAQYHQRMATQRGRQPPGQGSLLVSATVASADASQQKLTSEQQQGCTETVEGQVASARRSETEGTPARGGDEGEVDLPPTLSNASTSLVYRMASPKEIVFYYETVGDLENATMSFLNWIKAEVARFTTERAANRHGSLPTTMVDPARAATLRWLNSFFGDQAHGQACRIELMEFVHCEFQVDGQKLHVYYRATQPVRFLNLANFLYHVFHCRIWFCEVKEKDQVVVAES